MKLTLSDGSDPRGSLVLSGTMLYGVTRQGGSKGYGVLFQCDAVSGAESLLYSFGKTVTDGRTPNDSLILVDSVLYGTTEFGGGAVAPSSFSGSIFKFDLASGTESILHGFGLGTDGNVLLGSLLLSGQTLYGMSEYGGTSDRGTIFSIGIPEPATSALVVVGGMFVLSRRIRAQLRESGEL